MKKFSYRWQTARRICAICKDVATPRNAPPHNVTTPNYW